MDKTFDELKLTGRLPSPSAVGLRILKLTQEEDYSQEELCQTIQADPALAGRIIKLANAVLSDGMESVTSVEKAAMRLGASTVRMVALGFTLVSDNRMGECTNFNFDHYWSRSLARAVACSVMSRLKDKVDPAEAFTAGLLCGIGKLALATVHPIAFSKLLRERRGHATREWFAAENRLFAITHAEISSLMLKDWGFPGAISQAARVYEHDVARAHDEKEDQVWALVDLLRWSTQVADVCLEERNFKSSRWRDLWYGLDQVANEMKVERDEFYHLCDEVARRWEDWGQILCVPTRGPLSFVETAVEVEVHRARSRGLWVVSNEEPKAIMEQLVGREAQRGRRPYRVLIIDDEEAVGRVLGHHLEKAGYQVFLAKDGEEGLRIAVGEVPHIVITDWMMPGMSGVELCRSLRRAEAGKKMYILMVTAKGEEDEIVEGLEAGADDYLTKPFNTKVLMARIRAGQRLVEMHERDGEADRLKMQDGADMGIMNRKLQEATLTDVLTELPNRRYAMKRLKQEWERANRTGRPLSVIWIDLDHFKKVNDTWGHDIGDFVLRDSAKVIQRTLRRGDTVCRVGGEEFLAICGNSDLKNATAGADRIRAALEEHEMQFTSFRGHITASLGVAQKLEGMSSVDDLLKAADEMAYVCKAEGRNCVRGWHGPWRQSRSA
jgi:diguanylate cyclase (GGDEF)-like protein